MQSPSSQEAQTAGTPAFPHRFECLTARHADPILLIGAGLSYGLAPSPSELHAQYATDAESALGCHGKVPSVTGDDALYRWAQLVLEHCDDRDLRPPKLRLAAALGILDEPRWLGKQGLPLRGTTPRHRVIARLAREGRWAVIWSLNWDCLLEQALEEVGLVRDGPSLPYSWKSAYTTHVTNHDLPRITQSHSVCVHKPHGCVRALIDAHRDVRAPGTPTSSELADRFMITEAELTEREPDPVDRGFTDSFSTQLRTHPLITVGWRAAEPILRDTIKQAVTDLPNKPRLSIINRSVDERHHGHLVECYDTTAEETLFKVQSEGYPTTDALLLWIQAMYATGCLHEHTDEPGVSAALDAWARTLGHPDDAAFLMSLVDDFLPAWMRLCWRAGLVSCRGFEPHQLDLLLKPEVQVPWHVPNIDRPDLRAATRLLGMLPPGDESWECERFPGALWDGTRLRLVVPMPAWGMPADLSGLRPLVTAIQRDLGFVRSIAILPLMDRDRSASPGDEERLKSSLAALIRRPGFAQADRIEIQGQL